MIETNDKLVRIALRLKELFEKEHYYLYERLIEDYDEEPSEVGALMDAFESVEPHEWAALGRSVNGLGTYEWDRFFERG